MRKSPAPTGSSFRDAVASPVDLVSAAAPRTVPEHSTESRCARGRPASTVRLNSRADLIDESQQAGAPGTVIAAPRAAALEYSCGPVRGVRQGCSDGATEVELPVTVRIRTREFEKGTRRRIEQV